jgi:hypothetical protein
LGAAVRRRKTESTNNSANEKEKITVENPKRYI